MCLHQDLNVLDGPHNSVMSISTAVSQFDVNLKSIEQLVRFDDLLLDLILKPLERQRDRLVQAKVDNPRLLPDSLISMLRNIKTNESLKAHYQALYNQWLVLLVSYFGSAVRDLFVEAAAHAIRDKSRPAVLREILEAPLEVLAEIRENNDLFLADLLASGKDLSFQDMQSIGRAFSRYFDVQIERDDLVNDIIVAQASRHAIVHAGGVADRKFLAQLRNAKPRTLKQDIHIGEQLVFTTAEITTASDAMRTYLSRLAGQVVGPAV